MNTLAVIPARGGSKGLPGKNIRPFAGLPLLAHSILFAKACPELTRCIVSTDSLEVADVAKTYGAEVPFLRPTDLAKDDTPLWPVLQHALAQAEKQAGTAYDFFVLLDPTTPCRRIRYLSEAFKRLQATPSATGIVAASKPDFNPLWTCVAEKDGYMTELFPEATRYSRRQDVPAVYRINGALYIWRTDFMRSQKDGWRTHGKHLLYEVPDFAAISIDNEEEFQRAELFVNTGLFSFPWLKDGSVASCVR